MDDYFKVGLDYIVRFYLKLKICYILLYSEKVLNSFKYVYEDFYSLGIKWIEVGIGNGWRFL